MQRSSALRHVKSQGQFAESAKASLE
jgi:hypothetical protein